MTESEWLACQDPTPMFEFLAGKVSDRKLRLFACVCCRTVWSSIPAVFQEAIRVAEEHADCRSTSVELGRAVSAAHRVRRKRNKLERAVYDAVRSSGDGAGVAHSVARVVAFIAAPDPSPTAVSRVVDGQPVLEEIPPNAARLLWNASFASHLLLESSLLRDIIGNPFRPISINSAWQTPTVLSLAQAADDNRNLPSGTLDNARLAVLADALEDSNCDNADILNHCRHTGEHVRGCWALDAILGKE